MLFFDCAMVVIRLRMIFSKILPRTGSKLMSLYEEGFYGGLPGLRSTVTIADAFRVVVK